MIFLKITKQYCLVLSDDISDSFITSLKNHYINDLEFQPVEAQFRDGLMRRERKRNEIFVDLAVMDTSLVEKEWMNCDRQYHLRTHNRQKNHIGYMELLKDTDESVFLQGAAGIGKTSMLDYLTLQWAQDALWNGKDNQPNNQYIFRFNGRKLNRFCRELSVKDLFKHQYPFVPFELIESHPKNIVLIFDSLDEFEDINAFCEPSRYICSTEEKGKVGDILHCVFDRTRGCFPGHKSILAGRPEAINYCSRGHRNVKRVDVVGFTPNSVVKYIQNFSEGDVKLEETIHRKIKESDNLEVMSYMPVYLWIICSIFRYDRNIAAPRTITELYILIIGIYLKEHFKGAGIDDGIMSIFLPDLFKLQVVQNLLVDISKCAYEMNSTGKIVFTQDEMNKAGLGGNFLDDSEKHGFIVRMKDDSNGVIYQFRHWTLQEFFVALELFRMGADPYEIIDDKFSRSEVLPILAELLAVNNDSPLIIQTFVKALAVNTDTKDYC